MSSEITLKIIILKHHSALVNYVKITTNRVHVIFAIGNLKKFSWCNVIQQIKKPSPKRKLQENGELQTTSIIDFNPTNKKKISPKRKLQESGVLQIISVIDFNPNVDANHQTICQQVILH